MSIVIFFFSIGAAFCQSQDKGNALDALERAYQKTKVRTFHDLKKKLGTAPLRKGLPKYCNHLKGYRSLQPASYAWTNGVAIYLCPNYQTSTELFRIQTLIHETAHLNGVDSECSVHQTARQAMIESGLTPAPSNLYDEMCHITEAKP